MAEDDILIVPFTGDKEQIPVYLSEASAGADLKANTEEPVTLGPLQRHLFPTGIHLAIPPGWEGQVRPRSGLSYHKGVTVVNAPGTIDADYRGEIKVPLVNLNKEDVVIAPGERIAQLIIAPVERVHFRYKESLPETSRGSGGFGSTGS